MTDQTPPVDEMHYEQLAQDALRGVIRLALERAAEPEGIPGAHHFYITFKTRGAGVSVPPDVLAKYPDEMTVVLQHQYWDLAVEPDLFSVMLKFGGAPKVSGQAATETEAEKRRANTGRSALYETAGGVTGSELDPEQVKRRNTLLGN